MNASKIIDDIISTRKIRKIKYVSSKQMTDNQKILNRLRSNGIKYDLVIEMLESNYGGKFTINSLLMFIKSISSKINKRIDRLAYRNKSALICWCAENLNSILPYLGSFKPFLSKEKMQNDKNSMNFYELPQDNGFEVDPSDIYQLLNFH